MTTHYDDMARRMEELESEKEERDDRESSVKQTLLLREVSARP